MNEEKSMRLSQAARKLNVGTDTIIDFLATKEILLEHKPNAKITGDQFVLLAAEFGSSSMVKQEAAHITIGKSYASLAAPASSHDPIKVVVPPAKGKSKSKASEPQQAPPASTPEPVSSAPPSTEVPLQPEQEPAEKPAYYQSEVPVLPGLTQIGKINLKPLPDPIQAVEPEVGVVAAPTSVVQTAVPQVDLPVAVTASPPLNAVQKTQKPLEKQEKIHFDHAHAFQSPKVVGRMVLPDPKRATPLGAGQAKAEASTPVGARAGASRQTAVQPKKHGPKAAQSLHKGKIEKKEPIQQGKKAPFGKEKEDKNKLNAKFSRFQKTTGDGSRAKQARRHKKNTQLANEAALNRSQQNDSRTLQVTEFVSANELASLMNVGISEVLSACMSLGMIVSINQRLDAEAIAVIADEFGYEVDFVDLSDEETLDESEATTEALEERPPIVTIMGHVDHGKTSLLDCIRATKLTVKEAGGITQHIGAYDITTESGKRIVFLDTPGHEAFTAMRTRGAKVTDVIVVVVAADDGVMPQTKEALSHAQVAGCPIVFAINKMDKPQANPERVKEELANQNILVEDWGGKYQCQEISAKTGQGVNELLEKILLEAALLELKANPKRPAKGTIVESFLDSGRGYVATAMVQDGTLNVGDVLLAGVFYGKVKAMLDPQGKPCAKAPPATPVQILGLNGAPRAGDAFRTMKNIKDAAELAQKKQQVLREQTLRTKSQLTLDEIGRRLAVGNFQQINFLIKGDVDGSIEALADSLLKLSHEEVHVNILHKCVGPVTESDVLLAATAEAIIVAFHVKPSVQAKKLAEKEGVEIRHYSVIYDAIDDVRNTVQGLLAPTIEEVATGRAEIKKIFPISRIGNVAGCQVQSGFIKQSNPIRLIRKGTVVFTGSIDTLKHGLEEMKQVKATSECGIHIKNFDDIEIGDVVEGFERKEIKRKL